MPSSALTGKLEIDVEIKASPKQFHGLISEKPHRVHQTCNDKIQGCELHEGDWGTVGSVIAWKYVHGKLVTLQTNKSSMFLILLLLQENIHASIFHLCVKRNGS